MTDVSRETAPPRWIEYRRVDDLAPALQNPKDHDKAMIEEGISEHGFIDAPVVDGRTQRIVGGHGRRDDLIARHAEGKAPPAGIVLDADGAWLMPVQCGWSSRDDDDAHAAGLVLNQATMAAGFLADPLADLLTQLSARPAGLTGTGFTDGNLAELLDSLGRNRGPGTPPPTPSLADRFLIPPFSVLDARQGWWQNRKREWLAIGLQSELGRGDDLLLRSETVRDINYYANGRGPNPPAPNTRKAADQRSNLTGAAKLPEWATNGTENIASGTSIFDPVLCEIAYRWFSGPGQAVLDPFAGGSVRGITAGLLGRNYVGVDLSAPQIEANLVQAAALPGPGTVTYLAGDSRTVLPTIESPFDLLFSCPPYADLEVYSDDPADISNMPYGEFLDAYREIIALAADRLDDDRFAVWVVGEVRDRRGNYYGFVPDTIRAFTDAGLSLYNEAILVTQVASLPLRAIRPFEVARKIGKTHQNVLVFVKGDGKRAATACGPIDLTDALGDVDAGDPIEAVDDLSN